MRTYLQQTMYIVWTIDLYLATRVCKSNQNKEHLPKQSNIYMNDTKKLIVNGSGACRNTRTSKQGLVKSRMSISHTNDCAPSPSHKITPPCLPLHTTRALTVVAIPPVVGLPSEDKQLVVGRREAVIISGRRTRANGNVREVRPRVGRRVQHKEVVHITCRSSDSGR